MWHTLAFLFITLCSVGAQIQHRWICNHAEAVETSMSQRHYLPDVKTWLWRASKCTENILFWSEYKEPSLPCNWLMTQAAMHIKRTDVTFEQQVQPSLSFSSCSSCSSMFSLCILKTSAKTGSGLFQFFLSPLSPLIYSHSSTKWVLTRYRILALSVHARLMLQSALEYKHIWTPVVTNRMCSKM